VYHAGKGSWDLVAVEYRLPVALNSQVDTQHRRKIANGGRRCNGDETVFVNGRDKYENIVGEEESSNISGYRGGHEEA